MAGMVAGGGALFAGAAPDDGSTAQAPSRPVKPVRYEDFGAKGDGKTDDFDAIIAAHEYANAHGRPVRAKDGATYVIGPGRRTATIQTDTDLGSAVFLIDDTGVALEDRHAPVFRVSSVHAPVPLAGIRSLRRGQSQLGLTLPSPCLVVLRDDGVKHFIRRGNNRNAGSPKTEVLLVAADGTVDPDTPLIWGFDAVTEAVAYPVDEAPLTLRGGRLTTMANQAPSAYTYFQRGIRIERSRVVVEDLDHHITREGEHGAPYAGFLSIRRAAHVTIRNTRLSGHKTYWTIGAAGKPVPMGSYDLSIDQSIRVSIVGCTQINDINDDSLWGIMGSNYCRHLLYEDCVLSRFDAHQGVYDAIVRRSTVRQINLIGGGTFLLEQSTVTGSNLVALRGDYGSTWQGVIIIRNTRFEPNIRKPIQSLALIVGSNDGQHDFGHPCGMPWRVELDQVQINDWPVSGTYRGPTVFGNFNRDPQAPFPYDPPREIVIRDAVTASGKPLTRGPGFGREE